MSKPKLSLVIPCYNEENTLEQIVEYVLDLKSETLDLELVIVDDCSKDKSLEKAEALKKKYPDIIQIARHEVNQVIDCSRVSDVHRLCKFRIRILPLFGRTVE